MTAPDHIDARLPDMPRVMDRARRECAMAENYIVGAQWWLAGTSHGNPPERKLVVWARAAGEFLRIAIDKLNAAHDSLLRAEQNRQKAGK